MEEFRICVSYGKRNIEEKSAFPRCKNYFASFSLDSLTTIFNLLAQFKNSGVIEDFIIYSESLSSKQNEECIYHPEMDK